MPNKNGLDKQELEAIHEQAMAIYETVREKLEAEAWGDYFVVDIDNGEFRTTPDDYIPTADKLRRTVPGGSDSYYAGRSPLGGARRRWLSTAWRFTIDTGFNKMIQGTVNRYHEAIVSLPVYHNNGSLYQLEFVIDTGFSEYLTLPVELIIGLELRRSRYTTLTLADNRRVVVPTYKILVEWDGVQRLVEVAELEGVALIGMQMMRGYHLGMDVVEGGAVTITAMS